MVVIPCEECLVRSRCKQKLRLLTDPYDVTTFGHMIKCDELTKYMIIATARDIDRIRVFYGLSKANEKITRRINDNTL